MRLYLTVVPTPSWRPLSTNLVIKFNCIDVDGDIDSHYVDLNRLITAETRNRCSFYEVSLSIGQVDPFWKFDCCNSTRVDTSANIFAHTTSTCRPFLLIIRNVPDLSVTLQHKSKCINWLNYWSSMWPQWFKSLSLGIHNSHWQQANARQKAFTRERDEFFLSLLHQIYKILILMHFNARK